MTGVPLNIDFQQIVLHLLNFTILFGALYILLYKPVKNFMQKRVDYYKSMDDEANNNLKASEAAKAEYNDKLSAVETEIMGVKAKARQDIELANKKMIQEAEEEASRIISEAKADANYEKEKIIESAQQEISEMVAQATEKLVFEDTSEAFDKFLEAAEK